jgi:imidazole glycerol-phosphate synthase subunit HisH
MQKVVIIKYNAGNVFSVCSTLERLGQVYSVTNDIQTIQSADKVIFPGVGEASSAMRYLNDLSLVECIRNLKQPFLGICLGMQLMCAHSEENNTNCLGIFDIKVKHFNKNNAEGLKVPHVGWNTIQGLQSPLFKSIEESAYMYFVHSFYAEQNSYSIANTNYTADFASALQKENFYGVQFHPEKSAAVGQKIFQNFLEL